MLIITFSPVPNFGDHPLECKLWFLEQLFGDLALQKIGQSFVFNDVEYEEESHEAFKQLAELRQDEEHAELYLPSIIGNLCRRIHDLENNLQK